MGLRWRSIGGSFKCLPALRFLGFVHDDLTACLQDQICLFKRYLDSELGRSVKLNNCTIIYELHLRKTVSIILISINEYIPVLQP